MSSSEIKQSLRKIDFPQCAAAALAKIGQLICGRSPNLKEMDLALDLMAEFVFCEVDRRGNKRPLAFTALQDLQLLEVLIDYLNGMSSDSARNSVFLTLFSLTTATQRLGVLSKLVSIAVGIRAEKVLISASTWMQQLGSTSTNSCRLAEALVVDYFVLVPNVVPKLLPLPDTSPQFVANFLTAVGELYFAETKRDVAFPPRCLLQTIVAWISENHRLCVAAQLMQSPLPPGAIAMEATTPVAGLLKWCVLAPVYKVDCELYARLHLALLNSLLEVPAAVPPRAVSCQHLAAPVGQICRYTLQVQKRAADRALAIQEDSALQLSLDRYAQAIQVAFSVNCLYGNVDEFVNQLTQLPHNKLLSIVIHMSKRATWSCAEATKASVEIVTPYLSRWDLGATCSVGATWSCTEAMEASVEIVTHYPPRWDYKPDDPHECHWVLVLKFEDDSRYYVCEYFFESKEALEAGNLTSRCDRITNFVLRFSYKTNTRRYELGTVDTTPERLMKLINETRWDGGEYPFCPCQQLIADVVGKLGFSKVKTSLIRYMERETDVCLKLDEDVENSKEGSLDSTPKRATLKLLTSNLERYGRVLSDIGPLTDEGSKHWALMVQFDGDDKVHVCELYRNSDAGSPKGSGGIDHKCERVTKEEAIRGKEGIGIFTYGTTETSPEQLYKLAGEVSYNGQDYNLFLRNCQHWVTELHSKLKMDTECGKTQYYPETTSAETWLCVIFVSSFLMPLFCIPAVMQMAEMILN